MCSVDRRKQRRRPRRPQYTIFPGQSIDKYIRPIVHSYTTSQHKHDAVLTSSTHLTTNLITVCLDNRRKSNSNPRWHQQSVRVHVNDDAPYEINAWSTMSSDNR